MSGRYITTEVWLDDSDVEMYLEDFSDDELIRELKSRSIEGVKSPQSMEDTVHQMYVARTMDNTVEFDRLLVELFDGVLGRWL